MKPLLTRSLMAALMLSVCATVAHAGPVKFMAPPDANAPVLPLPGVQCVLRADAGQTRFRQGETIGLYASFTGDRPGYKVNIFVQRNRGMTDLGTIQIAPDENVTDPLGELPPSGGVFVNGYVPDPVALSAKPVEIPFVLNDWARFDKPGIYTITLTTTRVFAAKAGEDQRFAVFAGSPAAPIISAPLQIEIVAADAAWQAEQIQLWREYWRGPAERFSGKKPPRNDISFIGTRAAMTAIIEHLGENTRPRSSEDDSYGFRTGLIGFADRGWLIGEMNRFIEQPDYAVTQGFFGLLTELQSLQEVPRPKDADASLVGTKKDAAGNYMKDAQGRYIPAIPTPAQLRQIDWQKRRSQAMRTLWQRDWLQVADAVERKSGSARAMTLHSLLELAWNGARDKEPQIKARLPRLIAQLAPVFDQLPPLPRTYLLGNAWDRIKSPAFAPALERSWKTPAPTNDYNAQDADDSTLRRLYELDPKRGRALIIEQIRQTKPRVSYAALSVLPDATLPALDTILATRFETTQGEANALAARLIGRYSSAAELPRLKKAFDASSQNIDAAATEAMLAYFLRVNPGYGEAKLEVVLRSYRKREYTEILSSIAAQGMSPTLEQIAMAYLDDAGIGVEADAAKTLALYGSPDAQTALMARLQSSADAKYPQARAQLEPRFVEALSNAQSWLCPPAQLRQIRALCRTDEGRRAADEFLRARTDGEPLVLNYSSGTREFWDVDRYRGRGLESLRAKLAQFPRGTEFFWQKTSYGPEADAAFEKTQKWATARGLKIRPYSEITARRKALGLR